MSKVFVAALALVLSLGAFGFAYLGQATPDAFSMRSEVKAAIDSYELNDANSTTVYQQQVTNGWVARDLLEVIAKQNATIIENQALFSSQQSTTNLLLGMNALIIALLGISLAMKSKGAEPALSLPESPQTAGENF